MSFESLWPELTALHCNAVQVEAVEWKVLFASRPRPLLVPAGSTAQARAAVDFFVANRLLRWWGHFVLRLDRWLPSSRLVPLARSERFPIDKLFGDDAVKETCFAVRCGSPGPLRKLTIFCPAQIGEGTGEICKVAAQPSADDSISREVYWLRNLGKLPALAPFLPRLVRDGTLPCGRRFLTMSALAFGRLSSRFSAQHFQFLTILAARQSAMTPWSATEPSRRLANRINNVAELMEPPYRTFFADILREIDAGIGSREIPVCLVHGDFAPWNLRVAGNHLLAFDWEYAESGGSPLQDYLHFHLIARATGHRHLAPFFMRRLVAGAADHAEKIFGPDSGVADAAGYLTLHYLLDTVAFYTEASRYLDVNDSVIRAYLEVLEQRRRWLPEPRTAKEANLGWQ
jgi:hypothetical protein